jgi:hypothetical protein
MLREARRQNRSYQVHAYAALGRYAAARKDLDLSDEVLETITTTVEELTATDDDAMDVDDDKAKVNDADRDAILLGAIKAAKEGLYSPLALASSGTYTSDMSQLLTRTCRSQKANCVAFDSSQPGQLNPFPCRISERVQDSLRLDFQGVGRQVLCHQAIFK